MSRVYLSILLGAVLVALLGWAGASSSAPVIAQRLEDRAQARLEGVTLKTGLVPWPESAPGEQWFFKPESLQPIGAFKLRGGYNKIASLSPAERARGVIAFSSGNHAQGVAYAARLLGIRAVIVMPARAPETCGLIPPNYVNLSLRQDRRRVSRRLDIQTMATFLRQAAPAAQTRPNLTP